MFKRKWKVICRSQKQQNHYPLKLQVLKSEAGFTLVELLAAISILGIVIVLAGSVHLFGQRQFRSQSKSADQSNDLSYAMTEMTTELRRYAPDEIDVENNVISIVDKTTLPETTTPLYYVENNKLMHNGSVLIDYVSTFLAEEVPDSAGNPAGVKITINVHDTEPGVEAKDYLTTIYFRDVTS